MAEYIEREAVLKVLRGSAVGKYPASFYMGLFAAANEADKIPAADVVPVVRCKDCKWWNVSMDRTSTWCSRLRSVETIEDDYCSYGVRKDGDG